MECWHLAVNHNSYYCILCRYPCWQHWWDCSTMEHSQKVSLWVQETVVDTIRFIGLILLPLVGNAAEHVTSVWMACKGKMELTIGVSVGSSIQIAAGMIPLLVIIAWPLQKDLTLFFVSHSLRTCWTSSWFPLGQLWDNCPVCVSDAGQLTIARW